MILERISATLFAIRDFYDRFAYVPSAKITNFANGNWDATVGECLRRKGSMRIKQRYVATGAPTDSIRIPITSFLPAGISIATGQRVAFVGYQDSGSRDGAGVYAATSIGSIMNVDGTVWNATTPIPWANEDGIYFNIEYFE